MKIGNIELKNNLILAPMAGVSDVGFRALAVLYGADFAETEMISAKALMYNNKKTIDLLVTTDIERIKVVQIFGHDPIVMANACKSQYLKKFDIIDINMGCPAPKIFNNGDGSALLKNLPLAEKIITECVNATKKPIMVKFRLGVDDEHIIALEFAKMCERAGASAITVHGRTSKQQYSGEINYDLISKIVNQVNIPVIGNGNVFDSNSFNRLKGTNCAGIMIGRGTLGNPRIFYEILTNNFIKIPSANDLKNRFSDIENHIGILRQYFPDRFIVKHMKKHLLWYMNGVANSRDIKIKISTMTDIDQTLLEIKKFLIQNN